MAETQAQKVANHERQINGKNGLQDAWKDHEDRLRKVERFQAMCVGGAALGSVMMTVIIEGARYMLTHPAH